MAINGSINLLKYVGARKVSLSGKRGIFIPVDENPSIYAEGKGAYAAIRIVEHESEFDGKKYTHFIAADIDSKKRRSELEQSFGRDAVKAMTPILGNAVDYNAREETFEDEAEDGAASSASDSRYDDFPWDTKKPF